MEIAQVAQKRNDTSLANRPKGLSAVFEVDQKTKHEWKRWSLMWRQPKQEGSETDNEDRDKMAVPGPRTRDSGEGIQASCTDYFMTLDFLKKLHTQKCCIPPLDLGKKGQLNPFLNMNQGDLALIVLALCSLPDSPTQVGTSQSTVYRGLGQKTSFS